MTDDGEAGAKGARRRPRLLRWLIAGGLVTLIGVLADISQVAGVNLSDAVQFVRQHVSGAAPRSTPPDVGVDAVRSPSPSLSLSASPRPSSPGPVSAPAQSSSARTPGGDGTSSNRTVGGLGSASPTVTVKKAVSAHGAITDPADGYRTAETSVQLTIDAGPAAVDGWVWYVVVQPAHHTTSDYLYRMRPEAGILTVGIGPATGGSGATDDYRIRPALIKATAAATIGNYREDMYAPADARYFTGITIHRQSQ
jgi:hypothetical protein